MLIERGSVRKEIVRMIPVFIVYLLHLFVSSEWQFRFEPSARFQVPSHVLWEYLCRAVLTLDLGPGNMGPQICCREEPLFAASVEAFTATKEWTVIQVLANMTECSIASIKSPVTSAVEAKISSGIRYPFEKAEVDGLAWQVFWFGLVIAEPGRSTNLVDQLILLGKTIYRLRFNESSWDMRRFVLSRASRS